jgi:hypothetical protein
MVKPARSQFYWQSLLASARPSGISYRLANGKCGNITDPLALRIFYTRISARTSKLSRAQLYVALAVQLRAAATGNNGTSE